MSGDLSDSAHVLWRRDGCHFEEPVRVVSVELGDAGVPAYARVQRNGAGAKLALTAIGGGV